MIRGHARSLTLALLVATGCGQSFLATRPTETVTAAGPSISATLTRVLVTDGIRGDGLGDDARLVVELRVRNAGTAPRKLSPGSFSCLMELDARRPEQTRSLLPAGGGEGPFPGTPPDEGSVLAGLTIPPGEERTLWAIFEGYTFDGSDLARKVTLTIPLEGGGALDLVIADPARGGLRWEVAPAPSAFVIGLRSGSLVGGGLRGSTTSTELTWMWRAGRLRLDAGLLSTVLVATHGPLQSETSVLNGTGLTAHVVAPVFTWGGVQSPLQLGLYAGGAASLMVELPKRTPDMANPLHVYGLFQAEGGLEIAGGQLHLASTPFPLSFSRPPLPRWAVRAGYVQTWAGGATASGFATTLRFVW